jgi:hypothetical protein
MSLGGLHDEAEIRGHRKTYIGAMPGRLIQSLKKAGTSNPLFVLDEIDKVGKDFHGDPASALLEVLDPEQNHAFYDNYVEMEYDLSRVMFVATANSLSTIHPALRDRMEIIEVNGYTLEEKVQIAIRHLLPKQLKDSGIKPKQFKLGEGMLEAIVENYTDESGVRTLGKAHRQTGALPSEADRAEREIRCDPASRGLGEDLRSQPCPRQIPRQQRGRRGNGLGLDAHRRRHSLSGNQHHQRRRQAHANRQPRRCNEGKRHDRAWNT